MHIPSSIIASISLLAGRFHLVAGCPFATEGGPIPENHPELHVARRTAGFFEPDGYLIGTPSRANNALELPGLTMAMDASGITLADTLATASSTGGVDICVVRFQQLPPPASGLFDVNQNEVDRQTFLTYGDLMTQRFYDLSIGMPNGGIIFAGCTIGYDGAQSMCDAGIDTDRFCDPRVLSQSVRWPQAITGYKLTNSTVEAVKEAVETFRSTESGHLAAISFAYNGGSPEDGGSEVPGWGNFGTLLTKVVLCDDIPEHLMYYSYPNDTAVADFVDEGLNKTFAEDVYQWWSNYCGWVDGQQVCEEDSCALCAEAAPCFGESTGCSAFDTETRQWIGEAYSLCNSEQVIQCAPCFPDCYLAFESSSVCAGCVDAAPCFSSEGCAALDVEAGLWDGSFTVCNEGAFTCIQCFPTCAEDDACAVCAAAAPCFSSDGCAALDVEAGLWDGSYTGCNEGALACIECFPTCEDEDAPTQSPTTKDAPTTKPSSAGFSNVCLSTLLFITSVAAIAAARPDYVIVEIW